MIHLLRVEGVNHADSITDTEHLATRRGGSLLLLQAIDTVTTQFGTQLVPVSTSASAGLYRIRPHAIPTATTLAAEVHRTLVRHPLYRHATFVVDVVSGADFSSARRQALNANRWRQMRGLSFRTVGLDPAVDGACAVDEIRPSRLPRTVQAEQQVGVSLSVAERMDHGRRQKQQFHADELQHLPPEARPATTLPGFTHDFEDLARRPLTALEPATLAGKLAVFYADGNGFGQHAGRCSTPEQLHDWEEQLKAGRRRFLARLVEHASHKRHWQTVAGDEIRLQLETLIWGGDEVLLVVPGWCGLELAQLFFACMAGLTGPTLGTSPAEPLTHAAGLVLCHQQAPISRIGQLAQALAELGKRGELRQRDTLHWMVLENFDQAGGDLDAHLRTRHPAASPAWHLDWSHLRLEPATLALLTGTWPPLRVYLPRSALAEAATLLATHGTEAVRHPLLRRAYQQIDAALRSPGGTTHPVYLQWQQIWLALHPGRATSGPPAERPCWPDTRLSLDDHDGWQPLIDHADLAVWIVLLELWDYCPDWRSNNSADTDTATLTGELS